jgi:hypothetical protein
MPNALIKKYANKTGKSIDTIEKTWEDIVDGLKKSGKSENDKSFYPIVVSVLKKKLGINESITSYSDFILMKGLNVNSTETI